LLFTHTRICFNPFIILHPYRSINDSLGSLSLGLGGGLSRNGSENNLAQLPFMTRNGSNNDLQRMYRVESNNNMYNMHRVDSSSNLEGQGNMQGGMQVVESFGNVASSSNGFRLIDSTGSFTQLGSPNAEKQGQRRERERGHTATGCHTLQRDRVTAGDRGAAFLDNFGSPDVSPCLVTRVWILQLAQFSYDFISRRILRSLRVGATLSHPCPCWTDPWILVRDSHLSKGHILSNIANLLAHTGGMATFPGLQDLGNGIGGAHAISPLPVNQHCGRDTSKRESIMHQMQILQHRIDDLDQQKTEVHSCRYLACTPTPLHCAAPICRGQLII
jgi:hypothetical protein